MKQIALFIALMISVLSLSGLSQYSATDPRLDWWVIETDHFYIIYHTGLENTAQEAASMAEGAYENWETTLNYHIKDKTTIVLADSTDIDGGAADSTNQLIIINPSEARVFNEWLNSRNPNPLDAVITHEHGHVVDLTKVSGLSEELRNIFGNTVTPTLYKPLAFIEGIPIYLEMLRTGSERANDPRNAMYFRQMVVEGNFMPFDQILSRSQRSDWPSGYMISHDIGPWIVRYMGETYGKESIEKFDKALAEDPMALSPFLSQVLGDLLGVPLPPIVPDFGAITEKSMGVSGQQFAVGFKKWITDMFSGQIEKLKADGLTESTKISPIEYWNNKPSWSPDGQWIAYYHSDPVRGGQLRLVHPDGSDDHPIVTAEPGFGFFRPDFWSPIPSWSPDSQSIVYADIDLNDRYYINSDIYVYNMKTEKSERLTQGERAYDPIYTPDGKKILYARFEKDGKVPNLYSSDIATRQTKLLYRLPQDALLDSFTIAPEGNLLALSLWRWGGYQDVYVLPLSGGDLVPITKDHAGDFDPVFSPDGNLMLFMSDRDGVDNLYSYNFKNGQYARVTATLSGAFHPTISPDGKQVAFVGYSTKGYDIETMAFDPTKAKVIPKPKRDEYPARKPAPVQYPVRPYDANPSLAPNGWMPNLGSDHIGLSLSKSGSLFQQYYSVGVGYNFENNWPYYSLFYTSDSHIPPFSWQINLHGNADGSRQALGISYPVEQTLTTSASLSLELSRSYYGDIRNALSVSWDLSQLSGLDLVKNMFKLHTEATITNVREKKSWLQQMTMALDDEIHLPVDSDQRLAYHVGLGWGEGEANMFSIGGRSGSLSLRGLPQNAMSGNEYLLGRVEYRFGLMQILQGFGTFPFFLNELSARAFTDLGTAGDELSFDLKDWKVGLGAELQLSFTLDYLLDTAVRAGMAFDADKLEPQFYFDFGTEF
jgi:Tol biopolymer transport system component